jgi:alanyl-tRNA synthetase
VLKQEEERFAETLENGMGVLETAMASEDRMLDGETVFKLYDTFGFPLDLTADIARERGITVDFAGFEAPCSCSGSAPAPPASSPWARAWPSPAKKPNSSATTASKQEGRIVALYKDGARSVKSTPATIAVIVLDRTPFYAESGGQVGDVGEIASRPWHFHGGDTQKIQADVFGHTGVSPGKLAVGDTVNAKVTPKLASAPPTTTRPPT